MARGGGVACGVVVAALGGVAGGTFGADAPGAGAGMRRRGAGSGPGTGDICNGRTGRNA